MSLIVSMIWKKNCDGWPGATRSYPGYWFFALKWGSSLESHLNAKNQYQQLHCFDHNAISTA